MIYITGVRLLGGEGHQHVDQVMWLDPSTGQSRRASVQAMIDFIDSGAELRVGGDPEPSAVGVIKSDPPHLQTHADGAWTEGLLGLPRF